MPEMGLEPGSGPCKQWEPAETSGIRPDPTVVRPSPTAKIVDIVHTPNSYLRVRTTLERAAVGTTWHGHVMPDSKDNADRPDDGGSTIPPPRLNTPSLSKPSTSAYPGSDSRYATVTSSSTARCC